MVVVDGDFICRVRVTDRVGKEKGESVVGHRGPKLRCGGTQFDELKRELLN